MPHKAFCIGLTGSVGMGKTEAARMFAAFGLPVFDADAFVHSLYKTPEMIARIEAVFPGTTTAAGVNRAALSARLKENSAGFAKLEAIVHPAIAQAIEAFIAGQSQHGADFLVLDIPLLFEAEWNCYCDVTVVVSAAAEEQKKRVLSRPGMTEEKFALILSHQMPDSEKRRRADYVIDTGGALSATQNQVRELMDVLRTQQENLRHA